jgi:hypothetical protein
VNVQIRFISALCLSGLIFACTPRSEKPVDTAAASVAPEQTVSVTPSPTQAPLCGDHALCTTLRDSQKKCDETKSEADCSVFVQTFKQLAHKTDCKRSFDTSPVPSVWICDEDKEETSYPKLFERSAGTLSDLKFRRAQEFYASEEFRSTLDGAVAEIHDEASMKLSAKLKKKAK